MSDQIPLDKVADFLETDCELGAASVVRAMEWMEARGILGFNRAIDAVKEKLIAAGHPEMYDPIAAARQRAWEAYTAKMGGLGGFPRDTEP